MLTLKKHKKYLKYTGIVVLALAIIGGAFFTYNQITRSRTQTQTPYTNKINYDQPTDEQKKDGEETKIKQIEETSKPPAQQPGSTDKAAISNFSQDSTTKKVTVQTELTGENYQTCNLTLTSSGATITKTASVIYQNSFSTCAGFSIGINEFPTAGTWSATLSITKTDGKTITSATSQATITK